MRFLNLFVFYVFCSFLNYGFSSSLCLDCDSPSVSLYYGKCLTLILIQGNYYCKEEALMIDKYTIEINCYDAFQISMFSFGMFFLL